MMWVEFSISTAALVQVRNDLLPPQTQEVEVGNMPSWHKGLRTWNRGLYRRQHRGLRAISFVDAMPFQMPRLSMMEIMISMVPYWHL